MTSNKMWQTPDHPDDITGIVPSARLAAVPAAHVIHPHPGETLGDLTRRAYGANTHELRQRILNANANIEGPVIVPHG